MVSLLLCLIALAPLIYFVCLSNHIWMHVARVCFLPGTWVNDWVLIAQALALPQFDAGA
jgi:hypothetical protein